MLQVVTSTDANITIATAPATPATPTFTQVDPTCAVKQEQSLLHPQQQDSYIQSRWCPFAAYPAGGYPGLAQVLIHSLHKMLQVVLLLMRTLLLLQHQVLRYSNIYSG